MELFSWHSVVSDYRSRYSFRKEASLQFDALQQARLYRDCSKMNGLRLRHMSAQLTRITDASRSKCGITWHARTILMYQMTQSFLKEFKSHNLAVPRSDLGMLSTTLLCSAVTDLVKIRIQALNQIWTDKRWINASLQSQANL